MCPSDSLSERFINLIVFNGIGVNKDSAAIPTCSVAALPYAGPYDLACLLIFSVPGK